MRIVSPAILLLVITACGTEGRDPIATPTPPTDPTDPTDPYPDAGTRPPSEAPAGCNDLAQGIYVATRNGHLVRFDPETATFGAARALCPEVDGSAVAMSIDRNGHAWVVFTNGLLYDMDLESGACTVVSDAPVPDTWWWYWSSSLSFVSDTEGGASETLYYSFAEHGPDETADMFPCGEYYPEWADGTRGWCNTRVGTIDRASGALTPLSGTIEAPLFGHHLAGTGGGELWSLSFEYPPPTTDMTEWFSNGTPVLLKLDKTTGIPTERYPIEELRGSYTYWWGEGGYSGGLAFWGGRFYLFLHQDGARSASIHRYDPATGTLEEIMAESGLTIADVGVSTCAPLDII